MTGHSQVNHRKEVKLKNGHYYEITSEPIVTVHYKPILQMLLTILYMTKNTIYEGVAPDDHYDVWRDDENTHHQPEREPQ